MAMLEATEWYRDGGEDATSSLLLMDKAIFGLFLSPEPRKIKEDAGASKPTTKDSTCLSRDAGRCYTGSNRRVAEGGGDEFKHGLHVIPRSEIVAFLEQLEMLGFCRDYLGLNLRRP